MLIIEDATIDTLRHGMGKLYIRDVFSKDGSDTYIISGTFGFDITPQGQNHTIYSGRFDFRINNSNFGNRF